MSPLMRLLMSLAGTLNHWRLAMMVASSSLFSILSHHCWASITAISTAIAALGFLSTQSARMPSDFSGWFFQISPVMQAV